MNYFVAAPGYLGWFNQYGEAYEIAYDLGGNVYNAWGLSCFG